MCCCPEALPRKSGVGTLRVVPPSGKNAQWEVLGKLEGAARFINAAASLLYYLQAEGLAEELGD